MIEAIVERLEALRVVPVIEIDDPAAAVPLADALAAGGLPIAEITFRTDAAAEVIRRIRTERPAVLVGAGTVLTPDDAHAAHDAGASFAVAPGTSADTIAVTGALGLPFIPGVATPSDVQTCLAAGARVMKFFPAGPSGGPAMLKALAAPYRFRGARFIPTGGVGEANAAEYLAIEDVIAVGGSWIAGRDAIARGHWDAIADAARRAGTLRAG